MDPAYTNTLEKIEAHAGNPSCDIRSANAIPKKIYPKQMGKLNLNACFNSFIHSPKYKKKIESLIYPDLQSLILTYFYKDLNVFTTFSTVNPNVSITLFPLPDKPKRSIVTVAPSRPTY